MINTHGHCRMRPPEVLELVQQGTQNKTELNNSANVPTNGVMFQTVAFVGKQIDL